MNIIIFYEHYVREWNALQRLKKCFAEKRENVYIYNIVYERTKAYIRSLVKKPDIIFLPWFVDEEHEHIVAPFVKLNPQVLIINLHQEEISSVAVTETLYPRTEYTRNGSYHFVWGEYFERGLIEHGVNEDKIVITGNMRNDEYDINKVNKSQLAKEYQLDSDKSWILFAENRGWITHRNDERTIKSLMRRGMTEKDIEQWIRYTQESMIAFVDEMKSVSSTFAEQYEFIYRPHPGTRFCEKLPSCIHVINDKSIYEWIKCCELYLTCESTSIFEADMCGVPSAIIDLVKEPERLKMTGVHKYPRIDHLNDINDELICKLKNELNTSPRKYISYIGLADGNATDRTAAAVYHIMENHFIQSDIKLCKCNMLQYIKQVIFEIVTWIMAKLDLINKFHYPRSAYNEFNDIPYKSFMYTLKGRNN